MKMLAGGRFQTRNPVSEPASRTSGSATDIAGVFTRTTRIEANSSDAIRPMPADKASMLSRKFMAFVSTRIHNTVAAKPNHG